LPIVPGFKYDLFVSYALANDQRRGWVSDFIGALKAELERKSRDFNIWWDPGRRTEEDFNLATASASSESAVFLSVLSSEYGDSTYCKKEVAEFRQQRHPAFGLTVGTLNRFQAILIDRDFASEKWPPELRTTSPCKFYSDTVPLFSKPATFDSASPWVKNLWEVRDSIWATLEGMQKQLKCGASVERSYDAATASTGQATAVYLAEVEYLPDGFAIDKVQFTLTGPSVLTPAQAHELIFWVHVEEQKPDVLTRASAAHKLPISDLSVKSEGPYPLVRGSRLSVRLKIKGLNCPDSHKWITWTGEIGSTGFVVEVPANACEGTYSGGASIRLNGGEIAKMSFVVCLGKAEPKAAEIPSATTVHRNAFASYASEDRAEVLSRVQGMEAAYKNLNVFVDVVDIRSGQNWEQELIQRISESDVFYLFWCHHAMASDWVSKEWRLALSAKGEDFIDPIPLESPQLAPPPKELADKHFNDPLLAFIAAAGGGHF
jgi:TIR domain